ALITGASQGLGWELAKRLSSKGCKITILSRDESKLQDKINILNDQYPLSTTSHDYISFDLSKPELLEDHIKRNYINYKSINILINCAGISQHKLLMNTSTNEIINILNINLTSSIILSKLLVKSMMKLSNPNIINISSILSQDNVPGTSIYSISKIGLNKLSETISLEMSRKSIRCNSILPGLIEETEIGSSVNKEYVKGNGVKCSDIADTVDKILCDGRINGECIRVD
ncbi:hypothetical protein CANARDRAFT_184994, partial [[Candida] arabinofermentans NRRL YB-2248]